jgi:hypothetical protein
MTKKDLFRLIIKIFGLYSLTLIVFSVLPSNLSLMLSQFYTGEMITVGILLLIFFTALVIGMFLFLIFKSDLIIKWLKLDRGFDEDRIDFQNFNVSNIIKLAAFVIGGILVINNIPTFLSNCFFAFKLSMGKNQYDNNINFGSLKDYIHWATSFLNIAIGYFLVTNYNFISRILKEKNKEEAQ